MPSDPLPERPLGQQACRVPRSLRPLRARYAPGKRIRRQIARALGPLLFAATLVACLPRAAFQLAESPSASPATRRAEEFDLPANTGRLAYIGGDGNVYVTTPDRQRTAQITEDATALPEHQGLSYHRLSWSPDGHLAYAAVTRSGDQARSTLYVKESLDGPARVVAQSDDHFVIYVYWAPVPCLDRPDCHRLAYLIEEEDGVGLHVVKVDASDLEDQLVATGRPFYFSWSPDGRQILWHTGGAKRHNPDAQIGMYEVDQDVVRTLPQTPGLFLALSTAPTSMPRATASGRRTAVTWSTPTAVGTGWIASG